MKLKIVYKGYDKKLDDALEETLKKFHYEFDSSGYDFETKERDLLFTKKVK